MRSIGVLGMVKMVVSNQSGQMLLVKGMFKSVVMIIFIIFFIPKCIKMIFFYFKKIIFKSAHKNNLKHKKN